MLKEDSVRAASELDNCIASIQKSMGTMLANNDQPVTRATVGGVLSGLLAHVHAARRSLMELANNQPLPTSGSAKGTK
jgi:hypothetical protein